MEYPMIINDESNTTEAGTVGLTSHEAAHTYFPFYMGTNEKKYAWMDEGLAVMLPIKFQSQVEGNDPLGRNAGYYAAFAGKELEMPLMIPSILLRSPSYRVASYSKPGVAYHYLQDFLGRDTFRKHFKNLLSDGMVNIQFRMTFLTALMIIWEKIYHGIGSRGSLSSVFRIWQLNLIVLKDNFLDWKLKKSVTFPFLLRFR